MHREGAHKPVPPSARWPHPDVPSTGGFSLIELLVVVSIIALLSGMLLSGVSLVRDRAKVMSCLSNIRQLTLGIIAYTQDNNGLLPVSLGNGTVGVSDGSQPVGLGLIASGGYVDNYRTFYCPDVGVPTGSDASVRTSNMMWLANVIRTGTGVSYQCDYALSWYNQGSGNLGTSSPALTSTTEPGYATRMDRISYYYGGTTYRGFCLIAGGRPRYGFYRTEPHRRGNNMPMGRTDGSVFSIPRYNSLPVPLTYSPIYNERLVWDFWPNLACRNPGVNAPEPSRS